MGVALGRALAVLAPITPIATTLATAMPTRTAMAAEAARTTLRSGGSESGQPESDEGCCVHVDGCGVVDIRYQVLL